MPKVVLDVFRWVLIVSAAVLGVKRPWSAHSIVGLVMVLPVLIIFMNVFGFVTLPLYTLTREARMVG